MAVTQQASAQQVALGQTTGRGLKRRAAAALWMSIAVALGQTTGRGLKQQPDASWQDQRQGSARSDDRARIETYQSDIKLV